MNLYNFIIEYIKKKENIVADIFNRNSSYKKARRIFRETRLLLESENNLQLNYNTELKIIKNKDKNKIDKTISKTISKNY